MWDSRSWLDACDSFSRFRSMLRYCKEKTDASHYQSSEQRLLFGIGTRGYMLATCYRIPFICCCFAKRNQKHTIGKSISSARPSDWNSRLGACDFLSDFLPCCSYVERKIDASHWKLSKQRLLFRTGTRS